MNDDDSPNVVQPDNSHTPYDDVGTPNQKPTKPKSRRLLFAGLIVILLVIATGVTFLLWPDNYAPKQTSTEVHDKPETQDALNTENPFTQTQTLGDGKVTTSGPKKGYVYSCTSSFRNGGASHIGDWVDGDRWDPAKKIHVAGDVDWPSASVSITTLGSNRIVSSNDLPDHNTGIFPISRSDPAFQIDPNPNAISAQEVMYTLPATPHQAVSPSCTSLGPIGVMTNGVYLYNALDAAGKDAVAHEVQDKCDGHPQGQEAYHYHGYSSCFTSMSASEVIGYAIDGFGITGPHKSDGTYYSTDDLDECHGTTSTISWDGKDVSMYHYVMTAGYPYSIGCFKGTPVQNRPAGNS